MSETIWKFPLDVTDEQVLEIPRGARLLSVQVQTETPCLWAVVDPEQPRERIRVRIYDTGESVDEPHLPFVGTFQLYGGSVVGHVFATPEAPRE